MRRNEPFTDDSNDVIFVEEPAATKPHTSFKDIFSREKHEPIEPANPHPAENHNSEKETERERQSKENIAKMKADTTKRTDWDMFAEQDIDSNFDVSHFSNFKYEWIHDDFNG